MELSTVLDVLISLFFAIGSLVYLVLFFVLVQRLKNEKKDFWNSLGPKDQLGLPDMGVLRKIILRREGLPDEIYQEYRYLISWLHISGYAGIGAFFIILIESLAPILYSSVVSLWYRMGF